MVEIKWCSKYKDTKQDYKKKSIVIQKKKKIRFMLPLDLKCKKCKFKMNKGKKINVVKEKILNKNYLGISYLRFYFKCSSCSSGATLITDLKLFNYKPEINCEEL